MDNDGGEDLQQVHLRLDDQLLCEPFDLPRGKKKALIFWRAYTQPGEVNETVQAAASTPGGERLVRQAQGKTLVLGLADLRLPLAPGISLDLQRVPAGEFLMSSLPSDYPRAGLGEQPKQKVSLDEYFIGKYPVTVAQFAAFIKATGYRTTAEATGSGSVWKDGGWKKIKWVSWQFPSGPGGGVKYKAKYPVTQVSWTDAVAFCQWASKATGRNVRLPTSAEWEKAAYGMDGRLYPWGNEAPDADHCNFAGNVGDVTPVGRYSPQGDSPYGCADMAGNVWEWCSDEYEDPSEGDYYEYSGGGNPVGKEKDHRLQRGGSWMHYDNDLRSLYRLGKVASTWNTSMGFRCALSP